MVRYQRVERPWWPYLTTAVLVVFLLLVGLTHEHEAKAVAAQVMVGKVVFLDPGHGDPDPGSLGADGSLEKDIVLALAMQVRELLESRGATVHLTRTGDYDLANPDTQGLARRKREDLAQRVARVNEVAPHLLVSIHVNAFPSSRWSGAQTFYRQGCEPSRLLAELMQNQLSRITARTQRKASSQMDLVILREVQVPAVVVEVGFISNPIEAALLQQPEYQKRLSWAIYAGIAHYVHESSVPVQR